MSSTKTEKKLKVLFIAGAGRSGSTLLERILGELNGITAMGEVSFIWERGFDNNLQCGCGKRFYNCEFWRSVRLHSFPIETKLDLKWLVKTTQLIQRFRRLPFLFCRALFPRFNKSVNLYAKHFLQIYKGVIETNKSNVLIDSSKHVHGHILTTIPDIKLYILHLVRDGRATVYSWTRKKVYQEDQGKVIYFPRYHPLFGALVWFFDNLSAELLRLRCKRYLRVKYEDFTRNPRRTLKQILTFIDEPQLTVPFSEEFKVNLGIQHSVSGNPVRFKQGDIIIKNDKEWELAMPKATQRAVIYTSWPLLLRYGYLSKNF